MVAGDLELAGDIPPMVMVMVVDMADTTEVPTGVAITMAIMTDIMAVADIMVVADITLLHMHMARWIVAAPTGIPGLQVPLLQVQVDQPIMTRKIESRLAVLNQI
jgi:hypothetical protein